MCLKIRFKSSQINSTLWRSLGLPGSLNTRCLVLVLCDHVETKTNLKVLWKYCVFLVLDGMVELLFCQNQASIFR